jgi:hypothetical protein
LEGWADRQVLLVCELHRRAQQVVNSDGPNPFDTMAFASS